MNKASDQFSLFRIFENLRIRTKFALFMALIILLSLGTVLYLRQGFNASYEAIAEQQAQFNYQENISSIKSDFQHMIYWFTEMAVSLSGDSESKALQYQSDIKESLKTTENFAPEITEELRAALPEIESLYFSAIDAYFDENYNTGSERMTIAREKAYEISELIDKKLTSLQAETRQKAVNVKIISGNGVQVATVFLFAIIIVSTLSTSAQAILIVRPLDKITQTINELSKGNYDAAIQGSERKDEIGMIARALEVFRDNGRANEELRARQMEENERRAERAQYIEKAASNFENDIEELARSLTKETTLVRDQASEMTELSESTSQEFQSASKASKEASGNVAEVASAVEEFNQSIKEISSQINMANNIANETVEKVEVTNQYISELSDAGDRINEATALINDIAEKTNLLALNATIEAARAGEAGKGFAVVANEVKDLASQTSNATDEISKIIESIQTSTAETVNSMKDITGKIKEISETSTIISATVEEQYNTIQEISSNASRTADNNTKVDESISGLSGTAQKNEEAAHQVLKAVQTMMDKQAEIDMSIKDFLSRLKET